VTGATRRTGLGATRRRCAKSHKERNGPTPYDTRPPRVAVQGQSPSRRRARTVEHPRFQCPRCLAVPWRLTFLAERAIT
jgi:hypothetical protein